MFKKSVELTWYTDIKRYRPCWKRRGANGRKGGGTMGRWNRAQRTAILAATAVLGLLVGLLLLRRTGTAAGGGQTPNQMQLLPQEVSEAAPSMMFVEDASQPMLDAGCRYAQGSDFPLAGEVRANRPLTGVTAIRFTPIAAPSISRRAARSIPAGLTRARARSKASPSHRGSTCRNCARAYTRSKSSPPARAPNRSNCCACAFM